MSDPVVPEQQSRALETLDKITRFASEDLARTINRRSFMRRAGTGAFGMMLALATGKAFAPRQAAAGGAKPPGAFLVTNCAPRGPYCNYVGNSPPQTAACHGAHCCQHLSGGQI